jgi:hypothetical protein
VSKDIFISFASKDVKVAMTLCSALESRGFSCWIAARDIEPGANFQSAIVQALRSAKVMLLVFTANSNTSEEMTKELALASQRKLIVIPIRVEDVTPNDAFAYEFATRQWIDAFADWEVSIDQLSRRISQSLKVEEGSPPVEALAAEPVAPEPAPPAPVEAKPVAAKPAKSKPEASEPESSMLKRLARSPSAVSPEPRSFKARDAEPKAAPAEAAASASEPRKRSLAMPLAAAAVAVAVAATVGFYLKSQQPSASPQIATNPPPRLSTAIATPAPDAAAVEAVPTTEEQPKLVKTSRPKKTQEHQATEDIPF